MFYRRWTGERGRARARDVVARVEVNRDWRDVVARVEVNRDWRGEFCEASATASAPRERRTLFVCSHFA